jgi:hypothetical protein
MNANAFSQKDYENETAFNPQKNKPNQSQFPKVQNELKIACQKIWPHPKMEKTENFVDKKHLQKL